MSIKPIHTRQTSPGNIVVDGEGYNDYVCLVDGRRFELRGPIYKERWQMEIFFKALKQSLKI